MDYSDEQLAAIQKENIEKIRSMEEALIAIRMSPDTLMDKWQQLLQILLSVQLETMKNQGFVVDQASFGRFDAIYTQRSKENKLLAELNREKWLFLFNKAFGIHELKEISLQEAQNLIAAIVAKMTANTFLKRIDAAIDALAPDATIVDRRKAILAELFPLHLSVMSLYGFKGEEGYIQAQRALMDHYSDPLIMQSAMRAQAIVFRRAKL